MLSVTFEPLPDPAALGDRWCALEKQATPSFFTSWTWMGSWLRATGARPELLCVTEDGRDVALALVGRAVEKRLLGGVPTLRLNEAGDAKADRAFIEYNAPLCVAGQEADVAAAIAAALGRRRDWQAIRLSGMSPGDPLVAAIPAHRRILLDSSPAYHVDLTAVRAADGDYLSLLSANTRNQIKRSRKDYGPDTTITIARDETTAGLWLERMAALNTGRHADNAWDEPVFRAFAAEIVRTGMADRSVALLRVQAGEATIGYLLNFVHAGRAMNYQSAFAEPVSAKAKPGLMAHAAAAAHYAAQGLGFYSMLAGKDRYKQSLSTGADTLEWWRLERFGPLQEAEYWARRLLGR